MVRALSSLVLVLAACGPGADTNIDAAMDVRDPADSAADGGRDAATPDVADFDAAAADTGPDAPSTDAGGSDAGGADVGAVDASSDVPAVAECGNGVREPGEECDDGNRESGDACSPDCQNAWSCPPLDDSCEGARPSTTEHILANAEGCSFALTPWSPARIAERRGLIDALAMSAVDTGDLLSVTDGLNREARSGISSRNSDRLRNHEWEGFRWNTGDENVSYWYPQGISGSSDAFAASMARKYVLVSWYNNSDERPTRGVRISLADVTDLNDVRYRHLLLIEPSGTSASPNFGPVTTGAGNPLHAGGIVWWEDLLYVADTSGGLRVFDLSNVMRSTHSDTERIGVSAARFDARGYGFAVPELMRYTRAAGSCPVRFSFVALDRSSTPPALVTGEYQSDNVDGRIVVWDLDAATGLLEVREGTARATAAYAGGQTRMQGAVRYDGNIYISSSSQVGSLGRLYRTRPGLDESRISAWVYGAEDLYIDRERDIIWTAAEYPGNRDVVGIPIRVP
ncbi:MAG: cysteine-rich repeat protein [Polyangiales bacterium]|jgi:cysteine-rich repeat protein